MRNRSGEAGAQFGAEFGGIAIPVLAVAILGANEWEVGLLGAASTLAFLVVGLPAGAWVDRSLKRRVMMRANITRALAFGAIPILWAAGALQMWHLIVLAAVIGFAQVFFDVAYQSYIPVLVPRDRISDANGKLESTAQLAGVAGPGLGGLLLAVVQAPILLAATAITYLGSFVAIASIRDEELPAPRDKRRPLWTEIVEGLAFVWNQRLLRSIAACTALTNFFASLLFTMLPLLVLRDLEISPALYGIALSVGAVGGLIGAVLAAPASERIGEGTVIPLSALLGVVGMALFAFMPVFPSIAIALLMVGNAVTSVSVLVYNIAQVSFRQRICPVPLLGRMNASIRFVVWGVMPIAGVLSGVIATAIGIPALLWLATAGVLLAAGFVVASPLLGMQRLPTELDAH